MEYIDTQGVFLLHNRSVLSWYWCLCSISSSHFSLVSVYRGNEQQTFILWFINACFWLFVEDHLEVSTVYLRKAINGHFNVSQNSINFNNYTIILRNTICLINKSSIPKYRVHYVLMKIKNKINWKGKEIVTGSKLNGNSIMNEMHLPRYGDYQFLVNGCVSSHECISYTHKHLT